MTHEFGDAPIEAKYREDMRAVVKSLDKIFNGTARGAEREVGFILLVYPFGSDEGRCNYISNGADRQDVVAMMKHQIARFEGQPEQKGTA